MARARIAPATLINAHVDDRILREVEKIVPMWRGRASVINAALLALMRMSEEDRTEALLANARFSVNPSETVKVREKAGVK